MAMPRPAPADNPGQTPGQLNSWKEIAVYFNVSVRTVQRWERSLYLPVQRRPGQKGRIFVTLSDLNHWRENILAAERTRVPTASLNESLSRPPVEADPLKKYVGTLLLFSGYCSRTLVRMLALWTVLLKPGLWSMWPWLRSHQQR